jgi:hypothetical protein
MPPVKITTKTDKEPEPNQAPDPTMSAIAASTEVYSEEPIEKAPSKKPPSKKPPTKKIPSRPPPKKSVASKA